MALNDIRFTKGQGGLGRALPGEDYVSGLLFYSSSLPSGFSSTKRIQQVFSVAGAEALGILDTNIGETKPSATYLITTKGNTGDTILFSVVEPTVSGSTTVTLGTYTVTSDDSTIALQGAAWAAVINAGTSTHGYTASFTTATLTVTGRTGLGVSLNSGTPAVITLTGAFAGTLTQFTGGVGSQNTVFHYHISEYFRIQPQGSLYIGIFAVPSPYAFTEITTMQDFAVGKIRQIGVYKDGAAFSTADLTAIHNVCLANGIAHKPLSALYAANMVSVTNLATLTDLGLLTANLATAVISQDGGAAGAYLALTYGKSVTNLGAALGTVSLSAVSDCIGWIEKFNLSDGTECDTVAFANGTLYSAVDTNLISQLNTYRYVFLTKRVGITGSFWNDSHTSIALSSDYAYIENNRVIDKAIRGVYASLLPKIASPLKLNADGTMTNITVATLESVAAPNLDQMVRDGELSAYSITIDPSQNVQTTSKLVVGIKLIGVGVARNFEVLIGYSISL